MSHRVVSPRPRLLSFVLGLLVSIAVARRASSQTEYLVTPTDTDPAITGWNDPHVVEINRSVQQRSVLFVHFVGSDGIPENSKLILQQAANIGYRAIGLTYPNSWTVDSFCSSSSDPACYEKVRLEIIDGQNHTNFISVTPPDCIENRLAKLLLYLDQQHPADGWGSFLDNQGAPVWSHITLSGHSQGGGEAAMIASIHRVYRVEMFASPKDFSTFFQAPAAWLSNPKATPIDAYYGFCNTEDGSAQQLQIWRALGLATTGPSLNVDGSLPPFGFAHMLFTSATPARPGDYHGSVVVDRATPLLPNGTPLFADVWGYMCFPTLPEHPRAVGRE